MHVWSWREAYADMLPARLLQGLDEARAAQHWAQILAAPQPGSGVHVAEFEGRLAGFSHYWAARDDDCSGAGEIAAIYLLQSAWGHGLGRRLMESAIEGMRAFGYGTATLWVLRDNAHARGFYEHLGWSADGAAKTEVRGDAQLHEVRYRISV